MDDLTVRIERHPDLSVEVCQAATVVLAERIKEVIGSSVAVQLEEPGTLPRSEGKYKRVYDLRDAGALQLPRDDASPHPVGASIASLRGAEASSGRMRAMSENGTLRRGRPGYDQQGILDVAVAAFNQYGYDATSMGVLADRLGLSKSAIYHHFASKDEILERALDAALGALEGVLERSGCRDRAAPPTGSTTCCAARCTCSSTSCRT